mgnify:CR=1 FL=1
MKLYPAIDLYEGKAVRLFKGEYQQMTVYHENPLEVALDFQNAGATCKVVLGKGEQFELDEKELIRLMSTMNSSGVEKNADTNMMNLGYQDLDSPTSISFYFKDFEAKDIIAEEIERYNESKDAEGKGDSAIKYTDYIGLLLSSVSTM